MPSSKISQRVKGVFVSLQGADHGDDLVGGHLASGVLVGEDLVLVPDLPRKRLGDVGRCEVVLVPMPVPTAGDAERIKPSYLEAHGLKEVDDHVSILVRLAHATSLPPVTDLHFVPGKQLDEALQKKGTRFSDLLRQRGTDVGILRQDAAAVLSGVGAIKPGASPMVKVVTHFVPRNYAWSLCRWIRCSPGPRPPRNPGTAQGVTWVKVDRLGKPT